MANELLIESRQKSAYSNFMGEARNLSDKKIFYQNELNRLNASDPVARESIYRWATSFYDDIPLDKYMPEDRIKIEANLRNMNTYNQQMRTTESESNRRQFGTLFLFNARMFYQNWNAALINLDLGIQWKKERDIFTKTYDIADATHGMIFNNGLGIPISPQMEFFSRVLYARGHSGRDNIVGVEGTEGEGKSTFDYALATTLSAMEGLPFDVNYNFIFNESREYVIKLVQTAVPHTTIVLDESGNQASAKSWWKDDQQAFMNLIRLIRFHHLNLLVTWPEINELDKVLRGARTKFKITIKKQPNALVRVYNLNPSETSKEFKPKALKGKIAATSGEAEQMIEAFDSLKLLKIPFYGVPHEPWTKYEMRKEKSLSMFNIRSPGQIFQTSSELETEYLLSLPIDKIRISWKEVLDHAAKVGWDMNIEKLAKNIAKSTGQRKLQVYKYEDMAHPEQGNIDITPIVRGYIERLRQMKLGAQQHQAEMPQENGESFET